MPKQLYLAGNISGKTYNEATNWRRYVGVMLPSSILPISPMRGKDMLAAHYQDKPLGAHNEYSELVNCDSRSIGCRDAFDVRTCDMVLMNLDTEGPASVGTMIELGMAHAWRKPVVLVTPQEKGPYDHPMVEQYVGWWVHDLDDAIQIVRTVLAPNAPR